MKKPPSEMQRRDFLIHSSLAATGAAGLALSGGDPLKAGQLLDDLQHAEFASAVGSEFVLPDVDAKLVLQEVTLHPVDPQRPSGVRRQGFSLLFTVRSGGNLESTTHRVVHTRMNVEKMLLQQVTPDGKCLEAIYN